MQLEFLEVREKKKFVSYLYLLGPTDETFANAGVSAVGSITTPVAPVLNDKTAHQLLQAAIQFAAANHSQERFGIALIEAGGNLKAYIKMDGLYPGFTEAVPLKKAITSSNIGAPIAEVGSYLQVREKRERNNHRTEMYFLKPGEPLYSFEFIGGGQTAVSGGWPIYSNIGSLLGN